MFKHNKFFILLVCSSFFLFVFCFNTTQKKDESEFEAILKNVRSHLSVLHYKPQVIDDYFSGKVFNNYLEAIDGGKRFFLQEDITALELHKTKLDDYFKNPNLDFYNQSIDLLFKRLDEIDLLINKLLNENIDLNKEEVYNVDLKENKFAQNKAEFSEKWRMYIKSQLVQEVYSLETNDENKGKSQQELLAKAKENVKDNLSDFIRRFKSRKRKDFFSIYVNSYLEVYDPHTTYFSPKEKEDFDVNISGQLEGIGARLEDKKGYATISELIIGGPAWKNKELEVGDKIIKVAQGKDKESVDIVGMLLDESVRLIRGKKGSTAFLTIKKKDNSIKKISIVRDVVEYDATFAKSAVIKNAKGEKYGIIYLPQFYVNMNDKNGRNASDDVEKELTALKKENIKGLIFDVRDDGGGSLTEAIEIVGKFIDKGPVVQVKTVGRAVDVLKDEDSSISWKGPMVVLVNEFSASASEILAAALQDYKRAVIIGSKKTYGKGTVQSVNELNSFISFSDKDYGAIKLTIQKFYRINGGSTQLKGVVSDIVIPNEYTYMDVSESNNTNALEWDKINNANYTFWNGKIDLTKIISKSQERLNKETFSKTMNDKAKWIKELADNKKIPISLAKYKEFMKKNDQKTKLFDSILKYQNNLSFYPSVNSTSINIEEQKLTQAKNEDWFLKLKKDFTIKEAVSILSEIK